jgi:hypothetical protein
VAACQRQHLDQGLVVDGICVDELKDVNQCAVLAVIQVVYEVQEGVGVPTESVRGFIAPPVQKRFDSIALEPIPLCRLGSSSLGRFGLAPQPEGSLPAAAPLPRH